MLNHYKLESKNKIIILLSLIVALGAFLRFWQLGSVPPSLYWDEVSQAFNAYSLLETGKDEHGEYFPLARFKAFGDYKAPIYIYSLIPSLIMFGKTEFAVRFPSALYGTFTILVTFFLTIELFHKEKRREAIALFASFFLAISPWHIQLSRAAFEGNAGIFYSVLAIWLFYLSKRKRSWIMVISAVSFIIAFYSFNGFRLFIPLIILVLGALNIRELTYMKKKIIMSGILGIMLLIPFMQFLQTPESKLRYREVNIFSDLRIIEQSNKWQEIDNYSLVSRIFHNRRVLYAREYLTHYFDFFNPSYLFISGDENPRFSSQDVGQLYVWMLPLILMGFYQMITKPSRERLFILIWFFIAPLAAATARETPHALRSAPYIPTYEMIAATGTVSFFLWIKSYPRWIYRLSTSMSILIVLSSLFYFVHNYFVHFPITYAKTWQYGYKETMEYVTNIQDSFDQVVITDAYGRPYIYTAWYGNITPEEFHQTAQIHGDADGFFSVERVGKYFFGKNNYVDTTKGKTLYISSPDDIPQSTNILHEIYFPNKERAFIISAKNE